MIEIHIDTGQLGGGNEIRDLPQLWLFTNPNEVDFYEIKYRDGNFDLRRRGIFHYAIFAHKIGEDPNVVGGMTPHGTRSCGNCGVADGDDFIVADDGLDDGHRAHVIMHELGHNFGLVPMRLQNLEMIDNQYGQHRFDGVDSNLYPYEDPNNPHQAYPSTMNYNAPRDCLIYSDEDHYTIPYGGGRWYDLLYITLTRVRDYWDVYDPGHP
jgi:hypothetical protein